jgi:hypothetical protein
VSLINVNFRLQNFRAENVQRSFRKGRPILERAGFVNPLHKPLVYSSGVVEVVIIDSAAKPGGKLKQA